MKTDMPREQRPHLLAVFHWIKWFVVVAFGGGTSFGEKAAHMWLLYPKQTTTLACRSSWSVFAKFILLWVVSSSSSCSIDFSQRINYQRQSQASLRWAEGEMMFSFPRSLPAFVQAFSGAQGSGPCQGRAVRSTIHLLRGCLDRLRICRQVLLQSSACVCRRSFQSQGLGGG